MDLLKHSASEHIIVPCLPLTFEYFSSQVFSKLKENRFPGEIELRDLVGKKVANARFVKRY